MRGNGLKGLPTEKVISTIIMEISMTEVGRTINAMDMEFTRTKKVRCIKAIGTTTNKKAMAKKFANWIKIRRSILSRNETRSRHIHLA